MNDHQIKMDIKYTEAEYLSAARLLILQDSNTLFRLVLSSILIIGVTTIFVGMVTDFPWWAATIGVVMFLGMMYYNSLVQGTRNYFRGDPKFRDLYRFTFSDDGIAVKTAQFDSRLSWSLYTKVLEGKELYLLVYGKDIRMMTVIPKRAFSDRLQENAFRELLSRHISTHTSSPRLKAKEEAAAEYKPTSLEPPDWR